MAEDRFASISRTPTLPANGVAIVEPDDDADLEYVTLALNVASPGFVRVTANDGSIGDVFVAAGQVFPLRARRVWASGTTATGIRALY